MPNHLEFLFLFEFYEWNYFMYADRYGSLQDLTNFDAICTQDFVIFTRVNRKCEYIKHCNSKAINT